MHHPFLTALLGLLLLVAPAAHAAPEATSFEQSSHEGIVEGSGILAGLEYYGIVSGSATLTFEAAELEQAWQNRSVQTFQSDISVIVPGVNDVRYADDTLGPATLHLTTNQRDADLRVLALDAPQWRMRSSEGALSTLEPGRTELHAGGPMMPSDGPLSVPLEGSSVWDSSTSTTHTATGDFWVSLFGWTAVNEDGVLLQTGRSNRQDTGAVQVEDLNAAWLRVTGGTLTMHFAEGAATRAYVHSPTITTDGATTLTGLPTQSRQVFEGTTTLTVTSSGDGLRGVVTEGAASDGSAPATTALSVPGDAAWLWGGLSAMVFVAAFVFVALAARSTPMLEWRSYHALDRHRPRLASFWANLWTRRDPWDGHAWSARGEARMLMRHDRGAARDFTKAHALLPPEERAVNALHAARSHARMGHATQTAHWIGIVASLDINVLLTAREEPDFARVWDHASVQRAVRQVLGIGA